MSYFLDNPTEILNLLEQISDERLQILFGDSAYFKQWFKKHKINDEIF